MGPTREWISFSLISWTGEGTAIAKQHFAVFGPRWSKPPQSLLSLWFDL